MSLMDVKRAILKEKIKWLVNRHQEDIARWRKASFKALCQAERKRRK